MAYFEGTVEEFMRFLGGYARNRVQSLTSAYRKKIGKCEECGSHTKQLDAAHLHGKERLVIIGEILKDFTEDGVVKIDLNVFQEIFDQAHQPPENVIRILCKPCHRTYDRRPETCTAEDERETGEEGKWMVSYIQETALKKKKALLILEEKLGKVLDNQTTIYSNINNVQSVWWLEPTLEKVKSGFHMVLHDQNLKRLLLFQIPAGGIYQPENVFSLRTDKDKVAAKFIILLADSFKDRSGFDFTPYLMEEVYY